MGSSQLSSRQKNKDSSKTHTGYITKYADQNNWIKENMNIICCYNRLQPFFCLPDFIQKSFRKKLSRLFKLWRNSANTCSQKIFIIVTVASHCFPHLQQILWSVGRCFWISSNILWVNRVQLPDLDSLEVYCKGLSSNNFNAFYTWIAQCWWSCREWKADSLKTCQRGNELSFFWLRIRSKSTKVCFESALLQIMKIFKSDSDLTLPSFKFYIDIYACYLTVVFLLRCATAQMRSTIRPFAQWNLILGHFQHSKFNILFIYRIAHSTFETLHWLCTWTVAHLHVHKNKHLLSVQFSQRKHYMTVLM